ncbi:MAG: replication-associated recombination protein A [Elusimicrobia bacterium]|nr:replication-associated recombination protein A [Elusimicrobiota bacterium]
MSELFSAGGEARPLAARLAPRELDEFVGQRALLGPGKLLRRLVESGRFASALFFGPPGCGKTALARHIAGRAGADVVELNAVTAGVADIRKAVEQAKYSSASLGRRTLLLVDEIHHFNRSQQDALLPSVERGDVLLIGMTTENPGFYVNAALRSRVTAFEFAPIPEEELAKLLDRAVADADRGVASLKVVLTPEAKAHLVRQAGGDARRLLNALEIAALTTAPDTNGERRVTLDVAEESIQKRQIRYDKRSDDHYDHISAFIKSMRGSDPDAAVYWMAKMLEAGEDPRFIARRILICAAEDVGNADFRALLIAEAAFRAAEVLGMPEARIPLSQAALYVACAPKSNAAYLAVDAALGEVRTGPAREVPLHLRDASMDAEERGHGKGYKYAHDFPGHWVRQEYMPQPKRFYEPTDQGDEKRLAERLRTLRP